MESVEEKTKTIRLPNGERYPLVGGTRPRCFDGTNFQPRKRLENAPTPTSRVHALLGCCLNLTAINCDSAVQQVQ
jgi:hypothetical protein